MINNGGINSTLKWGNKSSGGGINSTLKWGNKSSGGGINWLYKFIKNNPWSRISNISISLNISKNTLEKQVKTLKKDKKIEFIWSNKTWWYFVTHFNK